MGCGSHINLKIHYVQAPWYIEYYDIKIHNWYNDINYINQPCTHFVNLDFSVFHQTFST